MTAENNEQFSNPNKQSPTGDRQQIKVLLESKKQSIEDQGADLDSLLLIESEASKDRAVNALWMRHLDLINQIKPLAGFSRDDLVVKNSVLVDALKARLPDPVSPDNPYIKAVERTKEEHEAIEAIRQQLCDIWYSLSIYNQVHNESALFYPDNLDTQTLIASIQLEVDALQSNHERRAKNIWSRFLSLIRLK